MSRIVDLENNKAQLECLQLGSKARLNNSVYKNNELDGRFVYSHPEGY